jgi:hypothetical protein
MDGAVLEENYEFQPEGFKPGKEKTRILFPRSNVNRGSLTQDWSHVGFIVGNSDSLTIQTVEDLIPPHAGRVLVQFKLSPRLDLRSVSFGTGYQARYDDLYSQNRLARPFDRESEENAGFYLYSPWRTKPAQ